MKKNPCKFKLQYVTSKFIATNDEFFKVFKDKANLYLLRYKKKTIIQSRCNQVTLNEFVAKK